MENTFCTNCGAPIADNKKFCTQCGSPVAAETTASTAVSTPQPTPGSNAKTAPPPVYQTAAAPPAADERPPKGSKYEPISMGGYIGIMLLMCIPVVGLVLMIVWALGGCRKVNKRSFARASLLLTVIAIVISMLISMVVKKAINTALEQSGIDISQFDQNASFFENLTDILGDKVDLGDLGGLGDLADQLGDLSELGDLSQFGDLSELGSLGDLENLE